MRVVNEKFETITEYDLSKGELLEVTTLREDMIPVDNVTKFAPDDEDWEQAKMYVPYPESIAPAPAPAGEPVTWEELDEAYQAGYEEGYTEGVNSAYDQ